MSYKLSGDLYRYDLKFKEPAMTSRGTYYTHTVWYPTIRFEDKVAIGECAPLPDLSCDFLCGGNSQEERTVSYESKLKELFAALFKSIPNNASATELLAFEPDLSAFRNYPSAMFGAETLIAHLKSLIGISEANKAAAAAGFSAKTVAAGASHYGSVSSAIRPDLMLWDSPFSRNEQGIYINGLIWMGDFETMGARIKSKLEEGFRCIKLKIGAIDFDKELALLDYIRQRFSPQELELRVDANGAFTPEEAPAKLEELSKFTLHSIEQPIKAGQYEAMAKLCANTPIPIGLDEEMIGINDPEQKKIMLDTIKPQYLVIKPSLHGGLQGTQEWLMLAKERGLKCWLTSALESTIGLNAIAQWVAMLNPSMPQGLGTGALYTNNLATPMYIKDAKLNCDLNMDEVANYSEYLSEILQKEATHIASFN